MPGRFLEIPVFLRGLFDDAAPCIFMRTFSDLLSVPTDRPVRYSQNRELKVHQLNFLSVNVNFTYLEKMPSFNMIPAHPLQTKVLQCRP